MGGRHLDLGYVDHPPLVPWLARLSEAWFGLDPWGLHVFPALAGASIVLLVGGMTAILGGGRYAQVLAAAATVACPLYVGANSLFQTVTFDQLAWTCALVVLALLLERDQPRWWIVFGLVAGIGLLTKYTMLVLLLGTVLGFLHGRARRAFRSPWLWLGAAVALLLVLPNLFWQVRHDWPSLEFIAVNSARSRSTPIAFLGQQILQVGPFAIPVAAGGFLYFLNPRGERFRPLGWTAMAAFALFLVARSKPYYTGPLYALLFAAGAVYLEPRFARRAAPPVLGRIVRAAPFALLLGNLAPLPYFLPILPAELYARQQERIDNDDFAEMFGWESLVRTVARSYHELPPPVRERLTLFTSNYGSASAIDLFGDRQGLPRAASGHNSYYFWTRGAPLDPVLAIGFSRAGLEQLWEGCAELGIVDNPYGVENEESGRPFFLCRGLRRPAEELWPELRHFD